MPVRYSWRRTYNTSAESPVTMANKYQAKSPVSHPCYVIYPCVNVILNCAISTQTARLIRLIVFVCRSLWTWTQWGWILGRRMRWEGSITTNWQRTSSNVCTMYKLVTLERSTEQLHIELWRDIIMSSIYSKDVYIIGGSREGGGGAR